MRIDLSNAFKSGHRILQNAISLLPNLAVAIVILILFIFIAAFAKSLVRRIVQQRQRRHSLALLLGQLTQTSVVILGFLIALSVVAPSFQAGDLIKMLGVGSVAIGFAFQNILQNFLAGILLLMQEPFDLGDWIAVTGIEGRVDDIQTRATIVTTKEGNKVVIPNATLFTNPVAVMKAPAEAESKAESLQAARA